MVQVALQQSSSVGSLSSGMVMYLGLFKAAGGRPNFIVYVGAQLVKCLPILI